MILNIMLKLNMSGKPLLSSPCAVVIRVFSKKNIIFCKYIYIYIYIYGCEFLVVDYA
jgi:hypothetical protein